MGLRMGQVQAAAEHMAQLVMQRHARLAQHGAAQPGAIQAVAARREIARRCNHARQAVGQGANALLGHQVEHGVAVVRIQPFCGMRDRVQAAGDGQRHRQRQRQFGVVHHGAR
ncbi:hypothetical protein D3C71_1758700 [compost metagenome]